MVQSGGVAEHLVVHIVDLDPGPSAADTVDSGCMHRSRLAVGVDHRNSRRDLVDLRRRKHRTGHRLDRVGSRLPEVGRRRSDVAGDQSSAGRQDTGYSLEDIVAAGRMTAEVGSHPANSLAEGTANLGCSHRRTDRKGQTS